MVNPISRSALSDVSPIEGLHTLNEAPFCGKINVRGDINDESLQKSIEKVLGVKLPSEANTVLSSDDTSIFWLGPDEWLAHVAIDTLIEKIDALRSALSDSHVAVTDVSDYYSVITLSGEMADSVIASASPYDTRPDSFSAGECAQTRFGHASILLWVTDTAPTFQLQVRWSYAQYVYAYLKQSIENIEHMKKFKGNP